MYRVYTCRGAVEFCTVSVCFCKVEECVIGVLIEQVGSLVEFLCLLAKRLDVALEVEWTSINLGVLDLFYLCLDSQPETA